MQPEAGRGRQDQPLGPVSGRNERRLGFCELRVDDQRSIGTKGASQQGEGFRPSGSRQDLIDRDVVGLGNGLGGGIGVRVRGEMQGRAIDDRAEPIWGRWEADIDGQIH